MKTLNWGILGTGWIATEIAVPMICGRQRVYAGRGYGVIIPHRWTKHK